MDQLKPCDIHSHILPGMDDGSTDVQMSLAMLKAAADQGVRTVFATPHYYSAESVEDFLSRRDQAEAQLRAAMAEGVWPEMIMGAEVAYRPGIGYEKSLEKLCLGSSRYLLLELPFAPWGNEVLRDVGNMTSVYGITPILAHLERYLSGQKAQTVRKLLEYDVLAQINAGSLLDWRRRGTAKRLLREGAVQFLGSDCHNMTTRPPNLGPGITRLRKMGMEHQLERMQHLTQSLLK